MTTTWYPASSWYPLLRRLRTAGWIHIRWGSGDTTQHVWLRSGQQITADELLSVNIGGVEMAATGLDPEQAAAILTGFGAFEPGSVA